MPPHGRGARRRPVPDRRADRSVTVPAQSQHHGVSDVQCTVDYHLVDDAADVWDLPRERDERRQDADHGEEAAAQDAVHQTQHHDVEVGGSVEGRGAPDGENRRRRADEDTQRDDEGECEPEFVRAVAERVTVRARDGRGTVEEGLDRVGGCWRQSREDGG